MTSEPDTPEPDAAAPLGYSARIAMTTVDCTDPREEAAFWAGLLGWDVAAETDDYAMVVQSSLEPGPALGFGRVEGWAAPAWPDPDGSKQFHLDLAVDDVPAAEARALELGATLVDPQPGETWRVLLDPAGHPFCLTDAASWA